MSQEDAENMIHPDLNLSCWINGLNYQVKLRKNALPEVNDFLDRIHPIENYEYLADYEDPTHLMALLIRRITSLVENEVDYDEEEVAFVNKHLLIDDEKPHLPVPVFSYVRPTMGHKFILHVLLSLGHFETELDLLSQPTLRQSLRYARLIGDSDDELQLQQYSDSLLKNFIENQLVYFPNSMRVIDSWIVAAGDLFDSIIIRDEIPIAEMPPALLSSIYEQTEEELAEFWTDVVSKMVKAIYTELGPAVTLLEVPSEEEMMNATRQSTIEWDLKRLFKKGNGQSDESFIEQKHAINVCIDTIDSYLDLARQSTFIKSKIICGAPGSGKTFLLNLIAAYIQCNGLHTTFTAMMALRAILIGGIHLHKFFCIPAKSNLSVHELAEEAIQRIMRDPIRFYSIVTLCILLVDEIGQLSAQILSVLDIIFRKIRKNNIFMGGVLLICTLDHRQLEPVSGDPFLTASSIVSCFDCVLLSRSV